MVSAEKTAAVLRVKKKLSKGEDIGFVGEVTKVNTELLNTSAGQ